MVKTRPASGRILMIGFKANVSTTTRRKIYTHIMLRYNQGWSVLKDIINVNLKEADFAKNCVESLYDY